MPFAERSLALVDGEASSEVTFIIGFTNKDMFFGTSHNVLT